jgi:hypothetical protein
MSIPRPILEIRDEDRLAAEAIGMTSGGIDAARVEKQIRILRELLTLIASNQLPATPACPELTNANPSSAHTALLETFAWLLSGQSYRLNQIPDQNVIAFHNLFGNDLRAATPAETTLRFTTNFPPPSNQPDIFINVPTGTQVSDASGEIVFETIAFGQINASIGFIEIRARRTHAGHCLLAPNVLTTLVDQIAWVNSVTNPSAIDSGTENESIASALERARQYQQRGERIVSDRDLENAIKTEILNNHGIVRVFPLVKNGQFSAEPQLGYSTVVVVTENGHPVDDVTKQRIVRLFDQLPGNQYVSISDPSFFEFDVAAQVRLAPSAQLPIVAAAIDQNLRTFYGVGRAQFGRPVLRSEIITVIEQTAGVDYVKAQSSERILIAPVADRALQPWQLAKVGQITITEF